MEDIKVSVLTPIYNHPLIYVRQCLDSLKAQTMQEIEFILIDNGAPEDAKRLISEYESMDSRFRVIHLAENQGYGKAMNAGLDAARGEYIGIVESDDWIEPVMYEELYKIAIKEDVDIVVSQLYYYFAKKNQNIYTNKFPKKACNKKLTDFSNLLSYIDGITSHWAKIYKREMIISNNVDFNTALSSCPDVGFIYKTFINAKSMYITTEAYIHYRRDNINSTINSGDIHANNMYNEHLYIANYIESLNCPQYVWDIKLKHEFTSLLYNYTNRCKYTKLNYAKKISARLNKYLNNKIFTFKYFNEDEIKELKFLAKHPLLYYLGSLIKIHPSNKNTFSHKTYKICGFKINLNKNKNYCKSFLQNIFSIQENARKTHKIINISGIKIKYKIKQQKDFNIYLFLFKKIYTAWTTFHIDAVIREYELIVDNPLYWDKMHKWTWLVFASALIEKEKYDDAKIVLRRYIRRYKYSDIFRFLPVANFAFECGFVDENIKKAVCVFRLLEENKNNQILEKYLKHKSIAIVGNSGRELKSGNGTEIDNHDIVIRCNNFPSGYEMDYGSKTNVWCHGIGAFTNDIKDERDLSEFDLVVWYQDFWHKQIHYNHLDILYRDLSQYQDKITYISEYYHKSFLKNYDVKFPTTGALIIYTASEINNSLNDVDIYGFSFLDRKTDNQHYFDKISRLSVDHNINLERDALRMLYKNKKQNKDKEGEKEYV